MLSSVHTFCFVTLFLRRYEHKVFFYIEAGPKVKENLVDMRREPSLRILLGASCQQRSKSSRIISNCLRSSCSFLRISPEIPFIGKEQTSCGKDPSNFTLSDYAQHFWSHLSPLSSKNRKNRDRGFLSSLLRYSMRTTKMTYMANTKTTAFSPRVCLFTTLPWEARTPTSMCLYSDCFFFS